MHSKILSTSISERIVCELPYGTYTPGFKWYELQISSLEKDDWLDSSILFSPEIHFIAASHAQSECESLKHISLALSKEFRYVLFESISITQTREALEMISADGAISIAACHMRERNLSVDDIVNQLQRMAELGSNIVKVAYPAYSPNEIATCLMALSRASVEIKVPVSITPMGTAWGRIVASLAGSYLVFAPLDSTFDRHSARDVVSLVNLLQTG
jgi:hypothetical protein